MFAFHGFRQAQFKPQLSASKSKCADGLQLFRARNQQRQVKAYRRLAALLKFFSEITVLDYTEDAVAHFENLSRSKVRIGSMDLKIAAIALSRDDLLLSRNLRDFRHFPKLRVEDWTTS